VIAESLGKDSNDTHTILSDANSIQHLFTYENQSSLWRAILAFKELQLHGRRSVLYRIMTYIRLLLNVHFKSWISIIPSLMRSVSIFLLLVNFIPSLL
jgi:hypothetical protein